MTLDREWCFPNISSSFFKHLCDFSQNKLDEALLTSGRVADALSSMLEWLSKVQASMGEDQPILGDLDTVSMLIEQHKVLIYVSILDQNNSYVTV